jgi:hypothetical protein
MLAAEIPYVCAMLRTVSPVWTRYATNGCGPLAVSLVATAIEVDAAAGADGALVGRAAGADVVGANAAA